MKTQIIEPDFIGGQGSLTKEEEVALSNYFSLKKAKEEKKNLAKSIKSKPQQNSRV